jgi:hypothetical protein
LPTSSRSVSILMPSGEASELPLESVEGDWYRLIPSRFPPISIYERVIANDRIAELVEVENLTNPRVKALALRTSGLQPIDPTSPTLQNWNLAPFTYPNPEGSHFFRPGYSVLELTDCLQGALATSVRKRETFLRRTREASLALEMRVLKTPVTGEFLDLRGVPASLEKEERWKIGDHIVQQQLDGILFTSPDRPSSSCIAVLKESRLGRSDQTKHFKFYWDGERIKSIVGFGDVHEIAPDALGSDQDIDAIK